MAEEKSKLFTDTTHFLKTTFLTADAIQRRYGMFYRDLTAYEMDYQNFIDELIELCNGYEHITS